MKSIGLVFWLTMSVFAQAQTLNSGADHFITTLTQVQIAALPHTENLRPLSADPIADCMDHLRQVTCLTDNGMGGSNNPADCDPSRITPEMMKLFPDLLRVLPPFHLLVLCHVKQVRVHTHLFSIGYASELRDANHKPIGTMIGVRLDVLLGSNPNHDIWSWKEQLNFGLSKMNDPDYTTSPLGPNMHERVGGSDSLLATVFVHEVGHLIDFLNKANVEDCKADKAAGVANCTSPADSFTALSWGTSVTYKLNSDDPPPEWVALYPWLSQMCYYSCTKTIAPANIPDVYSELSKSGLLTSYSARDPMEDFAEASMIHSLKKAALPFSYFILGAGGATLYDFDTQWVAPQVQAKRLWLEKFFARTDLAYDF